MNMTNQRMKTDLFHNINLAYQLWNPYLYF